MLSASLDNGEVVVIEKYKFYEHCVWLLSLFHYYSIRHKKKIRGIKTL